MGGGGCLCNSGNLSLALDEMALKLCLQCSPWNVTRAIRRHEKGGGKGKGGTDERKRREGEGWEKGPFGPRFYGLNLVSCFSLYP